MATEHEPFLNHGPMGYEPSAAVKLHRALLIGLPGTNPCICPIAVHQKDLTNLRYKMGRLG